MGDLVYVVSGAELPASITLVPRPFWAWSARFGPRSHMADNGRRYVLLTAAFLMCGMDFPDNPVLPAAVSDVAYIDGYIIWTFDGTDQFIISSLDNALIYDFPISPRSKGAGFPVGDRGSSEIQFYGKSTVEIWYNSGAADFPFERQGNAFIERGVSTDSLIKIDNSVHFVGDDRIIYRLSGYDPVAHFDARIEYALGAQPIIAASSTHRKGINLRPVDR